MKNSEYSVVRIHVVTAMRRQLDLLDLARRQADHLGPLGFRAKKRQTNIRFRRKGFLRFRFPTRRLAQNYVDRVNRLSDRQSDSY
jgi:hypothetical protein